MRARAAALLAAIAALLVLSGCALLSVPFGGVGGVSAAHVCAVEASNVPTPAMRQRDRRPRAFASSESTDANGVHVAITSDVATSTCVQSIAVEAQISYTGPADSIQVGVLGPSPVEFGVREMDGPIQTFPTAVTDCHVVTLRRGDVQSIPFFKSGTPPIAPPADAEFGTAYFADPELNLPVGEWEIFALASYVPGGCDSKAQNAWNPTSVVVTVTD